MSLMDLLTFATFFYVLRTIWDLGDVDLFGRQ